MTKNETKDSGSTNKVLIFGLLVGALYLGLRDWGGDDEVLIQGATVKRGDVEITVVERGNLSAKNAASTCVAMFRDAITKPRSTMHPLSKYTAKGRRLTSGKAEWKAPKTWSLLSDS